MSCETSPAGYQRFAGAGLACARAPSTGSGVVRQKPNRWFPNVPAHSVGFCAHLLQSELHGISRAAGVRPRVAKSDDSLAGARVLAGRPASRPGDSRGGVARRSPSGDGCIFAGAGTVSWGHNRNARPGNVVGCGHAHAISGAPARSQLVVPSARLPRFVFLQNLIPQPLRLKD